MSQPSHPLPPLHEEQVRLEYIKAPPMRYGSYDPFRAGMLAGYKLAEALLKAKS